MYRKNSSTSTASMSEQSKNGFTNNRLAPPLLPKTPASGEKNRDDVEKASENVKLKYPRSIMFIVVNEFCERFCYYGMRTVLALYLRNILNFNEDTATVIYHAFAMLCYFTPILGAIIADNFIGKFRTILYLSILYACGSIVLAVAAIPNTIPQTEFSMVGLAIIAFGTGGIKPCVSAFGGDQFVRPQQDKQLEQFFSVFYFAINAGSLISTFVTPILREDVHCFGEESCYSLAFGLPAVLMVIAIVVFVCGKPLYKIKLPEGNIMGDFVKCIWRGFTRKISVKGEVHNHWLDYAGDIYEKQLVEDTKQVLSVGFLFLPLPVFWALYDQQGSRWTFQATRMNGDLGGWVLKPDQVSIVNPLLILIMVPIFDSLIYPLFKKCNLLTPLQRIACGLVLCGLSFVVSGFVEISLEPTYAKIPGPGTMQLNFINTLPCPVNVSYAVGGQHNESISLNETLRNIETKFLPAKQDIAVEASLTGNNCGGITVNTFYWKGSLGSGGEQHGYSVLITLRGGNLVVARLNDPTRLEKSNSGQPMIGFLVSLNDETFESGNFQIKQNGFSKTFLYNGTNPTTPTVNNIIQIESQDAEIGTLELYWKRGTGPGEATLIGTINNLIQGGVYSVVVQRPLNSSVGNEEKDFVSQVEVTTPNSVSILWLLPQYFVVTMGEVMFSVTGLTFAFTQAPASMKSVVTAMWQLVVAFGNLIDIIVASTSSGMSQANEFFLFAGIMGVAAIIFTFMALPYKYVEADENAKKKSAEEEKKPIEDLPSSYSTSPKAMDPLSLSPIAPQTVVKDETAFLSETAQPEEANEDSQDEREMDDSTASLSKNDVVPSASTDVVQDKMDSTATTTDYDKMDSTATTTEDDKMDSTATTTEDDKMDSTATEDNNLKRTECNDENLVNDIFQFLDDL